MLTIAQAFQQFLESLELTPKQREKASNQHRHMREQLQGRLDVADNFLSGSYKRSTAVRPLNDIDIFLVLGGSYANYTPAQLLKLIQSELEGIYEGKTSTPQASSVHIAFVDTKIAYDVVPAFLVREDVYAIPKTDASGWIHTNPKVHMERSTTANKTAGDKLKPLFKAIKHAKNHYKSPARSFHLEVLSWSVFDSPPANYLEGLDQLLRSLAQRACDSCPDPAGLGPDIRPSTARCEQTQRWLESMSTLASAALSLSRDGKTGEAHAKLRELFGPAWPEKGTPGKAAAVVAGGGAVDDSRSRFG